jgi:hypothetical protein
VVSLFVGALLAFLGVWIVALFPSLENVVLLSFLTPAFVISIAAPRFLYGAKRSKVEVRSAEDNPDSSLSFLSAKELQLNRCNICGASVPVEMGLRHGLLNHYRQEHLEYYRWDRWMLRTFFPLALFALATVFVVFLALGAGLFISTIIGFTVFLVSIGIVAIKAQMKAKHSWRTRLQEKPTSET